MTNLIVNNQQIATDKDGYLLDMTLWSPEVAEVIARQENLVLTEEHWEIINLVRDFYLEYKTSPAIRMLVKTMQLKYSPDKANSRYLQRLFPDGPAKQASKLAGLPRPIKCL